METKKVLLSVAGLSPAVITETLYALMQKNELPTEIRVITTSDGRDKLLDELLGIKNGEKIKKGIFKQFIEDYSLKDIDLIPENILSIKNNGDNLQDIRTLEDNEMAADFIVDEVRKICKDQNSQLHVSIAGGRKTMGFYVAYALSIFGRAKDKLSHVLIDQEYEKRAEGEQFYYPTPYSKILKYKEKELDAKDCKVELAEIPLVLLNYGISENIYKDKKNKVTYVEMIKSVQESLDKPKIKFIIEDFDSEKDFYSSRKVMFASKEVKLSDKEYSFLLFCVLCKINNQRFRIKFTKEKDTVIEKWSKLLDKLNIEKVDFNETPNTFETYLNGACHHYNREVKKNFNLGKSAKSRYEITRKHSNHLNEYYLDIDVEDIDLAELYEYTKDIF